MKPLLVAMFAIVLAGLAGCDRSKPVVPTAPTAPSGSTVAGVTGLTVTGTAVLAGVGETTQLIASAALSDGTSRTVTGEATWRSSDPSVIAVSDSGLAIVIRFGRAYISALYQSKASGLTIEATPAGSFIAFGRLREPGSGGVGGARGLEVTSGITVVTGTNGDYSFGGLTGDAHLVFTKDGYEPLAFDAIRGQFDDRPMQRVIRIAAGATATVTLAPHDMAYLPIADGVPCYPCRLIRVTTAEGGVVHLRLSWPQTAATLNLWVNGRLFQPAVAGSSDLAADINAPSGELLVYVGLTKTIEQYVALTLSTAFDQK